MKIKFNSDDNLPLNKPLKFRLMTITIRFVFEEDGKLYPQVFLDDTLYQLKVLIMIYNFFYKLFFGIYKNEWDHRFNLLSKNRTIILNKTKDFYKNNKERLKQQARDKYRSLSEEKNNKRREYGNNRYHNMSEEKKERLKEYQKTIIRQKSQKKPWKINNFLLFA